MNLGMIVSRNARRWPDKIAVVDPDAGRRMTWQEFDQRVNQLAHALLANGLCKGDRAAIYARNGHHCLELFFACAKTGIIAQPLNWRYTPNEIAQTLRDGAPRGIIVSKEFADFYNSIKNGLPFIELSVGIGGNNGLDTEYEEFLAGQASAEPATMKDVRDDDVLFLLNTGGTTGVAKSVAIRHLNALSVGLNIAAAADVRENDCYMIIGPMFHSAVFAALSFIVNGTKIVTLNFEPRRALEVIQQEGVTSFTAVATMINYLTDVAGANSFDTSSLRLIIYGGSPISVATLRRALKIFNGADFLQVMAQTESGVLSLLSPEEHRRALETENFRMLESCGRGAVLSDVRIVNEAGHDVPKDGKTPGEMLVRGHGIMQGYWNMPELTAQTLRDGWCYSGDIATWDEDGFMYVVDRKKDMIISGGENIYSSVVEEAVCKHPAVKECAVIGVPHQVFGETVKAVVVLHEGGTATADEIIAACKQNLASYMKPTSVDFVNELPKTPAGKVLKRVLREKYWAGEKRQVGGV
jgi:acyl-CoA synthetase (AMP-forming)/AMP-acid ligase II